MSADGGHQGGFDLPNLRRADAVWVSAAYTDGALGYTGFGGKLRNVFGAGLVSTRAVDVYVDTLTGDLCTARG
jgi:hypothetical protein